MRTAQWSAEAGSKVTLGTISAPRFHWCDDDPAPPLHAAMFRGTVVCCAIRLPLHGHVSCCYMVMFHVAMLHACATLCGPCAAPSNRSPHMRLPCHAACNIQQAAACNTRRHQCSAPSSRLPAGCAAFTDPAAGHPPAPPTTLNSARKGCAPKQKKPTKRDRTKKQRHSFRRDVCSSALNGWTCPSHPGWAARPSSLPAA